MKLFIIFIMSTFVFQSLADGSTKTRVPSSEEGSINTNEFKVYKANTLRDFNASGTFVYCDDVNDFNRNFNAIFKSVKYKVTFMSGVPGHTSSTSAGSSQTNPSICVALEKK